MTIDLRSDTVTMPTQAMRDAMLTCEVGDDVLGEDPTINAIEEYAADRLGKEAALFVPSGTFGNQCSIMTHTKPGDEVILSEGSHIIQHEAGAAAKLSNVQTRAINPANGKYMSVAEVTSRLRIDDDIHFPDTGLVCLEQATSSGNLYPLEVMKEIFDTAHKYGIPVHIDGARLFNAASALEVNPSDLADCCDSVSICLSKGLCAPVGSLIVGSSEFIVRARQNRKIMGGGMRQAGFLAAAGAIALKDMSTRLKEDHANARRLESGLSSIQGISIPRTGEINMVFMRLENDNIDGPAFVKHLADSGVLTYPPEGGEYRFVTHFGVSKNDIDKTIDIIGNVLGKLQK